MMASEESILNCRLTCEQHPADFEDGLQWRYVYTIDDANYQLSTQGIERRPAHLWKSFKRGSSRPAGMAKLLRRALFGERSKPRSSSVSPS